jgi:hypothetical protein
VPEDVEKIDPAAAEKLITMLRLLMDAERSHSRFGVASCRLIRELF